MTTQILKLEKFAARSRSTQSGRLIQAEVDAFLLGGGSLLLLLVLRLAGAHISMASPYVWAAIYAVSFPHFMASYALFYLRPHFRKGHPFLAWGIPLLLVASLSLAVFSLERTIIVQMARLAFVGLFWHFLKQTYGAAVWLGGAQLRGTRPNLKAKKYLWFTCLAVGILGYLTTQTGSSPLISFGIYVPSLEVGIPWVGALHSLCFFAVMGYGVICLRQNISFRSLIPVVALYVWMQPEFIKSGLFLLLPLFHGLQYLPFCFREMNVGKGESRLTSTIIWWVLLSASGLIIFLGVPAVLTQSFAFQSPERIAPAILVFMNLHHFLLDSVLWRFSAKRGLANPQSGHL